MPMLKNDMMSGLVQLANLARTELETSSAPEKAREAIARCLGHDRAVIISMLELSDIKFQAKADDRPSVGDVNSHTDRWIDDDGNEVGIICGEGWKIARFGEDIISYYRETAETKLGRIEISGIWNSSAIWQKQWQSLFATGVSGEVAGMFGVRQLFQEVPRQRYRAFVLLIPLKTADESLQNLIRCGYVTE
ncbi:allene oxide cyclase barrel-like domain-containing protein [Xenorhabdus thuongxuanensis]|uniref:Allene oxide cyclase barrel-like domain-containing protein n=2 Tax=Xenorhabdus thuongxuanensis TaxID=1873484 RepID=A0A1Q5TWR6_9GAMM|nr:hypothetical protein Xentx_02609 [Xenorhabdus thuongxuanensis]